MFEGHFGLRENPFVAAHQTRYIYPSPEHQEALAHLRYGIENREPFVLITGEVGTGKTTALFDALSEWEGRAVVGLITNSSLTRAELLEEIALRLGMAVPQNATKPQIMVALERHLHAIHEEGLRAILLLDEAQNLERELLEEIRLLSNLESGGEKLVQIFLVGQPELEGRLQLPELRQLRQRIAVHYRLRPLGAADAERYIHHRISVAGGHALSIFPPDACAEVHRLTNGIPREMNHLAAQAMVCAFVEGAPAVTCDHVRMAARELEFQSVLGKERRTRNVAPAIERRQGPTIPGAAPPPEREMQASRPGAASAGAASVPPGLATSPSVARAAQPPAPAEAAPPVTPPPAGPPSLDPPAPSAGPGVPPATRADLPAAETDGPETGPPSWHPADVERRAALDLDDEDADAALGADDGPFDDEAGFDDELEANLEDDEAGDDAGDWEDEDEDEDDVEGEDDGAREDGALDDEGPEFGPPRLDARHAEPVFREDPAPGGASPPRLPPPASPADAAPAAPEIADDTPAPAPHVPAGAPPAPAASGMDWQSWFHSLASEAGSSDRESPVAGDARDPAADEMDDEVGTFAPPSLAGAPFEREEADEPAQAPEPAAQPQIIEAADSTSAFAAALKRAQEMKPADRDAAPAQAPADRTMEAPTRSPSYPARHPGGTGGLASLPPRLREKMAAQADTARDPGAAPSRIVIAAVLLLVVVAGALLAQRLFFAPAKSGHGTGAQGVELPAGSETPPAPASSTEAAAPERGAGDARTGDDAASQAASGAEAAPAPAPVTPAPAPTFALAVGTYLNETRAKGEQTRLSSSTSYQVTIATVRQDGVPMYRVTLQPFASRDAAERAASDLIARGLVDEARVLAVRNP